MDRIWIDRYGVWMMKDGDTEPNRIAWDGLELVSILIAHPQIDIYTNIRFYVVEEV